MRPAALRTVAAHELRRALRRRAAAWAGVAAFALLALSGWAGRRHRETHARQRERLQSEARRQWLAQPDRHPHRASHFGNFAFRPPTSLSAFDAGVDDFAGVSVYQEPHRRNTDNFSEARQSAALLRFGSFTAALALQLVAPLLIFFLGFSSLAEEREGGTLALALGQGVTGAELVAGKAVGVAGAAAVALAPGVLAAALLAGAGGPALPGHGGRWALLGALHVFYLSTAALLAVAVSALNRTARGALLALTGLWTALWVAGPRAFSAAAQALHPLPAKADFDAGTDRLARAAGDSHNPDDPRFADFKRETLRRHGAPDAKDLPFNFAGAVMREGEERTARVFADRFEELRAAMERQGAWARWAAPLMPFAAARRLSMALAGTDGAHAAGFLRQAEAHRLATVQALNDLHRDEIKAENDRAQKVPRARWEGFPAFVHEAPALRASLAGRGDAALGLALSALSVLSLAAAAGRRLERAA